MKIISYAKLDVLKMLENEEEIGDCGDNECDSECDNSCENSCDDSDCDICTGTDDDGELIINYPS